MVEDSDSDDYFEEEEDAGGSFDGLGQEPQALGMLGYDSFGQLSAQ